MNTTLIQIAHASSGPYTDITDTLASGSFRVTPKIYAPKRGQSPLTGATYGGMVATKREITSACKPLPSDKAQTLLQLVAPEYVYINYLDPELGWRTSVRMLSANSPAAVIREIRGALYWQGISIKLTEV